MGIFAYIIPQEWMLRIIILIMICLAVFVFRKCKALREIAAVNLQMLEKTEDVSLLERTLLDEHIDRDEAFTRYEEAAGKTDATFVLFEHIKAIYDAGAKSSRLDADLLVKNTVDKMFTGVDSVKSSISLFLVIGILGTLFGLAISIGGFSGANFVMTGQGGSTADQLSQLFGDLRGAFAPSMWGVFFTILFVFGYSWKVQEEGINKVTEKLTINTIRFWLPKLYPTDFQRGDLSLFKLKTTVANAEGINNGVAELERNLDSSNKTLRALTKTSKLIDVASDRFDKSVDKLAKVQALYDELKKSNEAFTASIQKLITSAIQDRKDAYTQYQALTAEAYEKSRNLSASAYQHLKEQNDELRQDLQKKTEEQLTQFKEQMTTLADNTKKYFDTLSEIMKQQNATFSIGLKAQNDSFSETVQNWQSLLGKQNEELKAVIAQLQAYDKNFFETVTNAGQSLDKSVEVNRQAAEANQALAQQLREIEDKLLHQQTALMNGVTQPIYAKLDEVAAALKHIQNPLNESTKAIQSMVDNTHSTIDKEIKSLKELADTLQNQQEKSAAAGDKLGEVLTGLSQTLQNLRQQQTAMMTALASEHGISPDLIQKYMENQVALSANSRERGQEKRQAVDRYGIRPEAKTVRANGFLSIKNIPIFAIAVLLLLSVITQVVMVTKISALEENQAAVNQVLMKGELNDSASAGSE